MKTPGLSGIHLGSAILCVIFVIWFYYRRQLHPLPGRYPKSSMLNAWLVILTIINQTLIISLDVNDYPCWLYYITLTVLLPITFFSVTLRAWMLLGQFGISLSLSLYPYFRLLI
jgi:hypothetical protein